MRWSRRCQGDQEANQSAHTVDGLQRECRQACRFRRVPVGDMVADGVVEGVFCLLPKYVQLKTILEGAVESVRRETDVIQSVVERFEEGALLHKSEERRGGGRDDLNMTYEPSGTPGVSCGCHDTIGCVTRGSICLSAARVNDVGPISRMFGRFRAKRVSRSWGSTAWKFLPGAGATPLVEA